LKFNKKRSVVAIDLDISHINFDLKH
jgi:hypothetical protein